MNLTILNTAAYHIHETAKAKGFWEHLYIDPLSGWKGPGQGRVSNPSIFEEKLMLIVSEVAEVLEARRDKDEASEEEECADVLIRLLDYCEARDFNIARAVEAKMRKNEQRPHLHGRAR